VPVDQRVGFPHRAQVAHQAKMSAVADRHAQRIRNRQGKARPLQQRAHLPDLGHRRDAGAEPAGLGDLGLRQGSAQLVQCLTPECRAEEQAIGGSARRHCTIWPTGIVRPVKRHGMDHQVMGAGRRSSTSSAARSVRRGPHLPRSPGSAVTIAGAVNVLLTSLSLSLISSRHWHGENRPRPAARGRGAGTKPFHPQDVVAGS
jgi:hypothetical protein